MKHWTSRKLKRSVGMHIASEQYIRIEIMEVPFSEKKKKLWKLPRGQLLIIAIEGQVSVKIDSRKLTLTPGDQLLLTEGESFLIISEIEGEVSVVEMIWTPGMGVPDTE